MTHFSVCISFRLEEELEAGYSRWLYSGGDNCGCDIFCSDKEVRCVRPVKNMHYKNKRNPL